MALRDLIAKFKIEVNHEALDRLNKGLDHAKEKVHQFGESAEGLEKINHGLEGIRERLDLVIGFEALKGLYEMTEKFAEMGEQIHSAAMSVGLGVEKFQELSFAAKQAGVSQDQLQGSIARLSRTLYEAKTGNQQAADTFRHLGFDPGSVRNLHTADQAMLALSAQLTKMTDPMAKLALTQKVLGRGSMEMVNFLSRGPAAIRDQMKSIKDEGLVMSESQVHALTELNHSFQKLHQFFMVIGATIAEAVAPIVRTLTDDFMGLFKANKGLLELNVMNFLKDIAWGLGWLDGFITTFVTSMGQKFGKSGWAGHILEVVAAIGFVITAVTALATLGGAFSFLSGGFATAFGIVTKFWGILTAVGEVIGGTLIPIVGELALAFGPVLLAIQAIHDLMTIAFGKGSLSDRLKETWTAKEIGSVATGAKWVGGKVMGAMQGAMDLGSSVGQSIGGGLRNATAEAFPGLGMAPVAAGAVGQQTVNNISSAPVFNINSTHGASAEDIANHVNKKIDDHHKRLMRETLRGVQGAKVGTGP